MRRGLARYDRQFDTSATAEDESCFSSELDLLNPKVTQSCHSLRFACRASKNEENDRLNLLELSSRSSYCYQQPVVNRQIIEAKLLTREADQVATSERISNIESSLSHLRLRKHEPQVTFEEKHSSEGERFDSKFNEKLWRLMYCADNRKENSTPRIVRVIRQNSRRIDPKADRSTTFDQPRAGNSKNSVVVLYHGRSSSPPSSSSKTFVRLSKSDKTIAETPRVFRSEVANPASPDKTRIIETPESLSPRYPLRRRRTTSRKYHRVSRQQHSLNVNIYHANRVERIVSPLQRHHWTASKRQIEIDPNYNKSKCIVEQSTDPVKLQDKKIIYYTNENGTNRRSQKCNEEERLWKKQYSLVEAAASKLMDHRPKQVEDVKNQKQSLPCSNVDFPLQQTQTLFPEKTNVNSTFISVNESNEANRVFPFQATPSGNLKIIPNQVVFESKKFSVLVADPRHTKVNVKTELNRSGDDVVSGSSNRTKYIDLPPGISPSTIDQLQAQKKLPYIEARYRSRTQPSAKFNLSKMESVQQTSYQLPPMNEVPLASLGFTNEQPINWDNIILPEKTDLYQELARRITNYKNADCIVRIDPDEFHCHLLVLQSYSTFFDEKNYKDINLSGSSVTSKAFSVIYDWMISPINDSYQLLRRDNILEIFMAAQYLGIKELEEQCWAFIDNDELFSEDTAFLLYLEAKKIGNTAVMELMVPRIMKFFLMLVSTKDFLELSVDELCLLLKSNYICVNSEIEVLMSAVRWLMHDWNERKQYMLEVLKCVRFGLIAPWQLVDVKRNPENPEFMELMVYPEVQKMVDDGLAFVIIKYWYGNQTEDYYHWIDLLGLSEPINRNWAGQDKNYVTYREFLLYLEEYQKTNISELKTRKTRTIPTPPNSPPKDCSLLSPERTDVDCNQNHCCVESHPLEQYSTTQIRAPKKCVPKVATSSGIMIPPEILTECFSNMGRSNNIRVNKTQCDGNRNSTPVQDSRYRGAGESPRKSLNFLKNEQHMYKHHQREISMPKYEDRQEKNVSDVYSRKQWEQNAMLLTKKPQKFTKKLKYTEDRTDSAKSEEEAATMIQATYRGYKVRRKFDEIKKSSSEEKQNAQKVAELLSMSTSQCGWSLHKSLNPVKMCNSVTNQNKNVHHI
ncbi:Kelch-like protein 26 [Formica fusca]